MTTHRRQTERARSEQTGEDPTGGEVAVRRRPGPLGVALALAVVGLACALGTAYALTSGASTAASSAPPSATAHRTWTVVPALAGGFALIGLGVLLVAVGLVRRSRRERDRTATRPQDPAPASACPVPHPRRPEEPVRPAASGRGVDPDEAVEFLRMFHAENPQAGPAGPRIAAALRAIDETGTYWHTPEELAFGARAAWRNNARCIGRLYWRSLQVRDLRCVSDAAGVARHCVDHLATATNGGKIRPLISVFAPEAPDRPAPRIWNEQLIRYAGYRLPDGSVLGDPRYTAFTEEMVRRGWSPPEPRGAFDVLPLVVETPAEGPRLFDLPRSVVREVELEHPDLGWFADLGLRWHAVPVISNSVLSIGGIAYPAAPFNGWYMGTEIGARNLGDDERYDLVPVVAARMGLDTSQEATLWRDHALVEINRAVLHSFRSSGVAITDHHTESRRFLTHVAREERAGRSCPADWSWIVPPMSGSQTPVFHRYYDEEHRLPNLGDEVATRRALEGRPCAFEQPGQPGQSGQSGQSGQEAGVATRGGATSTSWASSSRSPRTTTSSSRRSTNMS